MSELTAVLLASGAETERERELVRAGYEAAVAVIKSIRAERDTLRKALAETEPKAWTSMDGRGHAPTCTGNHDSMESCDMAEAKARHAEELTTVLHREDALRSELAEAKAALEKAREPGAEFDRGFIAGRANTVNVLAPEVERLCTFIMAIRDCDAFPGEHLLRAAARAALANHTKELTSIFGKMSTVLHREDALRSELAEAKAALEKARTFQNENAKIAVRMAEENKRLRQAMTEPEPKAPEPVVPPKTCGKCGHVYHYDFRCGEHSGQGLGDGCDCDNATPPAPVPPESVRAEDTPNTDACLGGYPPEFCSERRRCIYCLDAGRE